MNITLEHFLKQLCIDTSNLSVLGLVYEVAMANVGEALAG